MDTFHLYTTPVFVTQLPDIEGLCLAATRSLLARRFEDPGIQASNHGGAWHSAPDLAQHPEEPWPTLTRLVTAGCRGAHDAVVQSNGQDASADLLQATVQMWAMVMTGGGYATPHEHHDAAWSCAFYADAGDGDGALSFVDPRRVPATAAGRELYPSTFTLKPRTGVLVVFPGWLQHYVHPYQGSRPRVSLSANVSFTVRAVG